jgi:uncharacterized membrane protein
VPEEIGGIPLHPLIVHAVVVLIPLVSVGAAIIAFVPRWRVRYGVPLVILAAGAAGASVLAKESGEQLAETVRETDTLERHMDLGDTFFLFAGALLLALTALVAAQWWTDRNAGQSAAADTSQTSGRRLLLTLLAVGTVLTAGLATFQVVLVGDSGAKAVWASSSGAPSSDLGAALAGNPEPGI